MPLKIVRNDITQMQTEAIVNTASAQPAVGTGCDRAIYKEAGYEALMAYRKENIGYAKEGSAFLTPGFSLRAKYIIHAVSPLYVDGQQGEEEKLRSCYRESLKLAARYQIRSIAFPLIATGSFGYPREEGMRIAVDEIHAFLLSCEMDIFLVVFDAGATRLGGRIDPKLEAYIDSNYVREKRDEEYGGAAAWKRQDLIRRLKRGEEASPHGPADMSVSMPLQMPAAVPPLREKKESFWKKKKRNDFPAAEAVESVTVLENRLSERLVHLSDTFSRYLLYLIEEKGMENAEVYKRAIVDKKVFSKIKNNPDYHPQKLTALCLCVGAKLNLDETKDLLARAGYALSPCDKTDIIFSYFIENGIYDMIELDIQLEEHGLPCVIV